MSTSQDEDSTGEDGCNDFSNDISNCNDETDERGPSQDGNQQALPKAKRVACVLCRKRKLRCDGVRPACATCKRLQRDCVYDEVRRKSGPRRGYVKALEARLAQVETLLKTQDDVPSSDSSRETAGSKNTRQSGRDRTIRGDALSQDLLSQVDLELPGLNGAPMSQFSGSPPKQSSASQESMSWEMVSLGLDEPLPLPDVVDELNQLYFEKVHPTIPMIHRARYYAAMNLAPHIRPAVCLRYAMWASAAVVSDKYESLHEHFYIRARKYIQQDEMRGHGEPMITIAHCQTWIMLAHYEFKLMYFPRAWMSAGRACRMAQMMGTHRLDGAGLEVKQCLPPPKDLTDLEERRRTFWGCFCVDRYSSIGTGWPMTIEETDISTNLPVDEEGFENGQVRPAVTLKEVLEPGGVLRLNPFSAVILMGALFGRNLLHLHRPQPDDQEDNINGGFWRRHRHLDSILLNTALNLPDSLRLPFGLKNSNTIFLNMNIHTSTICLHQAAIFKADKNRMNSKIAAESKLRCITAASEIANIMQLIAYLDTSTLNPFVSFCLYVAARVFVQYLKSRPGDAQVQSTLHFLLTAMHAIKRKNPLTESFLVQLDVDLEVAGLEEYRNIRNTIPTARVVPRCPTEHLPMEKITPGNGGVNNRPPTYGDMGAAAYNDPRSRPSNSFESIKRNDMPFFEISQGDRTINGSYQLPSRGRTPSSVQNLTGPIEIMDVSPDGSDDHNTPSSNQNTSSHTSNTGYSPSDGTHASSMPSDMNLYRNNGLSRSSDQFDGTFDINFSLPTTSSQDTSYVLPPEWSPDTTMLGNISGLPQTGLTPGVMGVNDMPEFTDADWNDVINSTQTWDTAVFAENLSMQEMLRIASRKRH